MNTALIILGLTTIYYIVLFYFDNKRKRAFQLAKNNAIGKTTDLPLIEETKPENLFGETDQLESAVVIKPTTIVQKATAAKNLVHKHSTKHLKEDLEEITVDIKEDETINTNQAEFIESLRRANPAEEIGEEEIAAFIKTPHLSADRQKLNR